MSATILIIEDDPALLKMYSEKFKMEGFEVIMAKDGEEGIKELTEKTPNVILLDMILPKSSGLDLLNLFKEDIKKKNITVIALTNLAQKEEAKKTLELGAKEYLVKAMYAPEEVVNKVKAYIKLAE